jgi:hypothetical protein
MRLAFLIHFLTLVVLTANAAPEASIKPTPLQTKEKNEIQFDRVTTESLQVSPAPVPSLSGQKWKASNGSTNLGIGLATGQFNKDKETLSITTYQLQRTQYNLDETAQEFGLALTSNGLFSLDWGFKKFCCFTTFAADWDPFYKFGIAGIYEPKDQLGNFVDYQRYFGQVSAGFESLFKSRRSFHFEAGGRIGPLGSEIFAQVFYAIPD